MYKPLKDHLWKIADRTILQELRMQPKRASGDFRVYLLAGKKNNRVVFITAEYEEIAGGHFSLAGGLSAGRFPSKDDVPSSPFRKPGQGEYIFLTTERSGFPRADFWIDLEWQVPSRDLVFHALKQPSAQSTLRDLGVTRDERHHLLSYGILSALGVKIPDSEFAVVCERFRDRLCHVLQTSVKPMVVTLDGMD